MNNWIGIPIKDLLQELFMAEQNLDQDVEKLWYKIKIFPEIWKCTDVIEENFWVVAKAQNYMIWYNDIVESFNVSSFQNEGEILNYFTSKHDLNTALRKLKTSLK